MQQIAKRGTITGRVRFADQQVQVIKGVYRQITSNRETAINVALGQLEELSIQEAIRYGVNYVKTGN